MVRFKLLAALLFVSTATLFAAPPANDNFASAIVLNGNNPIAFGTNAEATLEVDEPLSNTQSDAGQSVWYTWTPSVTGTAFIETNGSEFDTVLSIYTGSALNGLIEVGSDDDQGDGNTSQVSVAVTAGTTYHISIQGYQDKTGPFALAASFSTDVGRGYVPGNVIVNEGATLNLKVYRIGGSSGSVSITLGFSYAGTALATSDDIGVFTSAVPFGAGVKLATVAVPIVDDALQEADETFFPTLTSGTMNSAGQNATGTHTITIYDNEHPANDSYDSPITVTGESGNFTFNNKGATPQAGEPIYKSSTIRHNSTWYQWTAPSTGLFQWTTTNATTIGVKFYTQEPGGFIPNNLTLEPKQEFLPYTDAFHLARNRIYATSGVTYTMVLDDLITSSSASGNIAWSKIETIGYEIPYTTANAYVYSGGIAIYVGRSSSSGEVSIAYTITPLTADPANVINVTPDASGYSGSVTFESGDSYAIILISTPADGNGIGGETFQVDIAAPNAYSLMGNTSVLVSIYDNDSFGEPALITGLAGGTDPIPTSSGDLTVEANEPIHGPDGLPTTQQHTAWFDWVAPSSGPFIFQSEGDADTETDVAYFSIYTGDVLASLTRVEPLPVLASSTVVRQAFTATAGTHYKVGVRESNPNSANSCYFYWQPGSTISFSAATYTVDETQGTVAITLNRTGDTTREANVTLSTEDITTNSFDYTALNTVAFFDNNETTKVVNLSVNADSVHEVTESLRLKLTQPEGNAFLVDTTATVNITSPDTFTVRPGTFSAAVRAGNTPALQGTVTITIAAGGKLTGKLLYGGKTYNLKGALDSNGAATFTITKVGAGTLTLNLKSTGGANRFVVTLADGANTGDANADIRPYDGKNNLAPSFGTYTARIDGAATATSPGIASVTVGLNGAVKIVGSLADGTPFTASSALSVIPDFGLSSSYAPFHIPLYKGAGYLSGDLVFEADPDIPLTSTLSWLKPNLPAEKFYPAGLSTTATLVGSRYTPPSVGVRALPGLDSNGALDISLSGPGIMPVTAKSYWLINNFISTGIFTNPKLQLKVAPKTGLITGSVILPTTKPTVLPLKSVILQGSEQIAGFYLNGATKTSGSILGEK